MTERYKFPSWEEDRYWELVEKLYVMTSASFGSFEDIYEAAVEAADTFYLKSGREIPVSGKNKQPLKFKRKSK